MSNVVFSKVILARWATSRVGVKSNIQYRNIFVSIFLVLIMNWNTKIQKGLEKIVSCQNKVYLCGVKINIKIKELYIMYLTSEKKEELFSQYGKSNKDTGSVESQVALFSYRIAHLTEHLKKNHKDFATQRSLIKLVGKRRALLDYMKKRDIERYRAIVKALNLRK